MKASHLFIVGVLALAGVGCDDATGSPPKPRYQALLLPYVEKGASVAAMACTESDGCLALLSPLGGKADRLRLLGIHGSAVEPFDEIPMPEALRAACPAKDPAMFLASNALALAPDGHGLVLATVGCGRNSFGPLWFERVAGTFVWVPEVGPLLPKEFRPGGLACVSTGDCYFSFNRGLALGVPLGPSSSTVLRWRDGKFDALLLDEQENEDDRFIELRSLAAANDALLLATVDTRMFDDGSAVELGRMFVIRADGVVPVTGPDVFGPLTPAYPSAQATFVMGAGGTEGGTDVIEITAAAGLSLHGRLPAVPGGLRTHVALLEAGLLEVREDPRAGEGGWDNVLTLAGQRMDFPAVTLGASVTGLLVRDREALLYGEQLATGPLANLRAPLFVRITDREAPASAAPLPNEIADDACGVAADCLGQPWGVRCQGHFACPGSRCERVCDVVTCGDGHCDAQAGESPASCLVDCPQG
jgi:hypothetical protein